MGELEDIYTREWVEGDFKDLDSEFDLVADAIFRQFHPHHVHDIGCGPGQLIARLADHGVQVHGVDGSRHCIETALAVGGAVNCIEHVDIRELEELSRSDLVICTEVAEHLDAAHADHLVSLLCSAMAPVIFTAAPPGQGGHHHVNEQPPEYWREKFMARGLIYDSPATTELRDRWWGLKRLSHMTRNVMVFR